jgi:hypothetical protein
MNWWLILAPESEALSTNSTTACHSPSWPPARALGIAQDYASRELPGRVRGGLVDSGSPRPMSPEGRPAARYRASSNPLGIARLHKTRNSREPARAQSARRLGASGTPLRTTAQIAAASPAWLHLGHGFSRQRHQKPEMLMRSPTGRSSLCNGRNSQTSLNANRPNGKLPEKKYSSPILRETSEACPVHGARPRGVLPSSLHAFPEALAIPHRDPVCYLCICCRDGRLGSAFPYTEFEVRSRERDAIRPTARS